MRLGKFTAENAGPFQSVEIDFGSMAGIWTITGSEADRGESFSNGVGKTALYDIVSYALTGRSIEGRNLPELVNDSIASGDAKGRMATEIVVDDMVIRRGVKPRKFQLLRGGEDITSTTSQDWLWREWRLNWDTFQFLMRFGGGESGDVGYSRSSAEFKRRIQDCLIQASRITDCLKTARSASNDLSRRIIAVERDVAASGESVASIRQDIFELSCVVASENTRLVAEQEKLLSLISKWRKFDFTDALRIAAEWSKLDKEIIDAEESLEAARTSIEEAKGELDAIDRDMAKLERGITGIADGMIDESKLDDAVTGATDALKMATLELDRMSDEVTNRDRREREMRECAEQAGKFRGQIERAKEELGNIIEQDEFLDGDSIAKRLTEMRAKLAQDESRRERLMGSLGANASQRGSAQIKSHIAMVKESISRNTTRIIALKEDRRAAEAMEPGTTCCLCGSPVNDKSLGALLSRISDEIAGLSLENEKAASTIEDLGKELDEAASAERDEAEDKKTLAKLQTSITTARSEIERTQAILDQHRTKRMEAERAAALRDDLERRIDSAKNMLEGVVVRQNRIEREIADVDREIKGKTRAVADARAVLDAAKESLEEARDANADAKRRIAEIKAEIRSLGKDRTKITEKIAKTEALIAGIEPSLRDAQKKQDALRYDDGSEPETAVFLEQVMKELKDARLRIKDIDAEMASSGSAKALARKKSDLAAAEEREKTCIISLDTSRDDLRHHGFWVEAFGSDGIRSLALKDLVPVLNDEVERYMNMLEGQRVRVGFADDLGIELRDWDTGRPISYARCSGGMKKRVNIAITCAFRETMRLASDCDLPLFIVDEAADALDEPGMIGFTDILQEISKDATIWVISHNPVLRSAVDAVASGCVHIEMSDKESRVFVEQR
jgi:DNA repair exonuclease SbcCD ATPase subunit